MKFFPRLLALGLIALLPVGCATSVDTVWEDTKAANTVAGYNKFIKAFPNSPHIDEAKQLRSNLNAMEDWKTTQATDSIPAYASFLQHRGDTEMAQTARLRIDELRWEAARDSGRLNEVEKFVREYPDSRFIGDANKLIASHYWSQAKRAGQIQSVESFLVNHAGSDHEQEARALLESMYWERISQTKVAGDARRYIELFPDGEHVDEVRDLFREKSWQSAKYSIDPVQLEDFLGIFGDSEFADEAKARLEALRRDAPLWKESADSGKLADYEMFIVEHPDSPYSDEARRRVAEFKTDASGRDISSAIFMDKVEAWGTHASGTEWNTVVWKGVIEVNVRKKVSHNVVLLIPAGTQFLPRSASVTNTWEQETDTYKMMDLVASEGQRYELNDNDWHVIQVPAQSSETVRQRFRSEKYHWPSWSATYDIQAAAPPE